jgi:hypothetical protein
LKSNIEQDHRHARDDTRIVIGTKAKVNIQAPRMRCKPIQATRRSASWRSCRKVAKIMLFHGVPRPETAKISVVVETIFVTRPNSARQRNEEAQTAPRTAINDEYEMSNEERQTKPTPRAEVELPRSAGFAGNGLKIFPSLVPAYTTKRRWRSITADPAAGAAAAVVGRIFVEG